MGEVVTLLTSASGHSLVKRFRGTDVIQQPFSTGKLFNVSEEPVSDLKSLSALLQRLESDPTRTVIRGSLTDGQNIPSAYRSVITINGYRTVEADYSQFHPNILYHQKQAKLTGKDAYERILGSEHRDLSKQIFNACLNSSYETNRPPKGMNISHTGFKWREIKDRLRKAHPQIEDAFFTDQGMRLQFYDSQMAELVMLAFAKDKKPILPVHDSFLVLKDDQQLLLEKMKTAYQQVLGKDIKIDLKKEKFMRLPPSDDNVFEEVMAHLSWLERNDAADEYYGRMI